MKKRFISLILLLFQTIWINPLRACKLRSAKNYSDLYQIAQWEINLLSRFGIVSMLSAPLFSGGAGSFQKNLLILRRYIAHIRRSDSVIIFSQIPYLDINWSKGLNLNIDITRKVQEFYVPLIKSKKIRKLICIGGIVPIESYPDSKGCRTEREAAFESGIEVEGRICMWLHH